MPWHTSHCSPCMEKLFFILDFKIGHMKKMYFISSCLMMLQFSSQILSIIICILESTWTWPNNNVKNSNYHNHNLTSGKLIPKEVLRINILPPHNQVAGLFCIGCIKDHFFDKLQWQMLQAGTTGSLLTISIAIFRQALAASL